MQMAVTVKNRLLLFALLLSILLSTPACTFFKNYGQFVPAAEVTAAFEKADVNPAFNYYITGSDTYPRSILGLNKAYLLDSDLWKNVDFKPEDMRELTNRMQQRALDCCLGRPIGFAVLDAKGRQIGVWYSVWIQSISIKVQNDNMVIIFPPNDREYLLYDGQLQNNYGK